MQLESCGTFSDDMEILVSALAVGLIGESCPGG